MSVRTQQGDTLDKICYRHYGHTSGITELVLAANPGLAEHGPILPSELTIALPPLFSKPSIQRIQLWD
jgi:phage tail protein X